MLDGSTLINKFHSSNSNYNWSLKTKGSLVYIENKDDKVLGVQREKYPWEIDKFDIKNFDIIGYIIKKGINPDQQQKLIEEDFVEDNPKQLWKMWKKAKPHYLGKKNKQGKLEHIQDNGFIFKKINKN